ncbi:hypothetical protein OHB12_05385 [Nocardia sp. NBC_01730]|uniref:hypothetical protein n=1 Tax=Nocardia sp. NBC_01730 TaxID=2975998 RepID=UPI002E1231A5|nr:hypothetical protein OHB12_05385 [Nocardia sp. NBC_01730]
MDIGDADRHGGAVEDELEPIGLGGATDVLFGGARLVRDHRSMQPLVIAAVPRGEQRGHAEVRVGSNATVRDMAEDWCGDNGNRGIQRKTVRQGVADPYADLVVEMIGGNRGGELVDQTAQQRVSC